MEDPGAEPLRGKSPFRKPELREVWNDIVSFAERFGLNEMRCSIHHIVRCAHDDPDLEQDIALLRKVVDELEVKPGLFAFSPDEEEEVVRIHAVCYLRRGLIVRMQGVAK